METKVKILNSKIIEKKYKECVKKLNKNIKSYKCWKLSVVKTQDYQLNKKKLDKEKIFDIFIIDEALKKDFENTKFEGLKIIKNFRNYCSKVHKTSFNKIEKHILKPLLKEFHKIYSDFFAEVSYGYSTTTHISQGKTFLNVFVDHHDILKNWNGEEAKRCFYTAVSRASNKIFIYIVFLMS